MRIISGKARGTKLFTLEGYETTRPTLDRVKEALFSKINMDLQDAVVLDLFSGSGALGLESISRGAKKAFLVDESNKAINIIKQNIRKVKFDDDVYVYQKDYLKALELFKNNNIKFDFIFLDPPYKTDLAVNATKIIMENGLLTETGTIIIETDIEGDILIKLKDISLDIIDIKKYGRVSLIFIRRKG